MHLQLNLSNQLANQWETPLSDAPPETHPLLRWQLDKIKLGRKTESPKVIGIDSNFRLPYRKSCGGAPITTYTTALPSRSIPSATKRRSLGFG